METIHVIFLAILQGFTEFLPISSSGHLILPTNVWGWPDQGLAFDVAVHVGTLIAVVGYFHRDIIALTKAWCGSLGGNSTSESRLAWFVIWATVPCGLAGLIFHDFIEQNLRGVAVIAITTIVFGLLLGLADWKGNQKTTLKEISFTQAMVIGLSQMLALIPGTSRSGATITAALAMGLDRQSAARFSFLLSIPIITLSGGYQGLKLLLGRNWAWRCWFPESLQPCVFICFWV